jgi:serine/threonine-protein kinase
VTARELLDASAGKIDQQFAADRQTQIELLGVAAEIYRELGEDERYGELHRRRLAAAREYYGERHPVVLAALLDEASRAKDQLDRPEALRLLDTLDPLIRSAGLDRTAYRARWWLIRGQVLLADSSSADEQSAALRGAAELFAEVAPTDPARVTALADLGTSYQNRLDYASARIYLEQSIAVSDDVKDRNDAELATIYGNLGQISQNLGDFAAADEAYARAEQIIRRTYGESRPFHWIPAANRARAAHLGGNRERAGALFAALLESIPPDSNHHDAVEAREWYAGCLAAEGRALEALPLLEDAERFYQNTPLYDYELPRVRATLGDAYDRVGRADDARRMLREALEWRVANAPPDFQTVLASRERWGRFLLSQGDTAEAETQFREVIRQAGGRSLSHIALAHGGIARVALARADLATALSASRAALDLYENVTGFRDVRMGPYLWLIHSEVLRQSGDAQGARAWATQALDARRRFDHPSAASIAEAEAALQAADSGTTSAPLRTSR